MKIAIDFDGTIVDNEYSDEYLDKFRYTTFILRAESIHNLYIVTARNSMALPFIEKYSFIPRKNIICCDGEKNKISYLKKNKFDLLIDNDPSMLKESNSTIKINITKTSWKNINNLILEKKPFSPGPVPQNINFKVNHSHRSESFFNLYKETKEKVLKELKIKNRDLLFIQGSGSSGLEATFSSLKGKRILLFTNGTFGNRAEKIAGKYFNDVWVTNYKEYVLDTIKTAKPDIFFFVQFETSKSLYNEFDKELKYCQRNGITTVVDCVSSLGYYNVPNADVICSSSAKILSGCPVMGLVAYKNEKVFLDEGKTFYFDIKRYIESDKTNQTPHTSLIPQIYTLNTNISNRVLPKEIEINCKQITTKKLKIEGEKIAPVLTFKGTEKQMDILFKWFQNFNIEPYFNKVYMKDYFQLSMFSYKDKEYYKLINDIIEAVL